MSWLRRLFGGGGDQPVPLRSGGLGVDELARRVGMSVESLRGFAIGYTEFTVPKRRGGARKLAAPTPALKTLQRTILRKVLARLAAHEAATGFERGHSIAT